MARYNELSEVTPAILRSLAGTIRGIAGTHERLADWMEQDGVKAIDARLMKTELDGLVNLCKFVGAAFQAYQETGCIEGISEMAGAVAFFKKETKRIRDGVKLAVFLEKESARIQERKDKPATQSLDQPINPANERRTQPSAPPGRPLPSADAVFTKGGALLHDPNAPPVEGDEPEEGEPEKMTAKPPAAPRKKRPAKNGK